MTTKDQERAQSQAKAQLESIVGMVKRLEHTRDCKGDDCELTDSEIYAGIDLYYTEGDEATEEEREKYHDEDAARQSIEEDPLSVQVRSDWHTPGEEGESMEYEILLCTGGPACRITGDLGQYNNPETAQIEYQDWFTPWARYGDTSDEEDEALLTYAQQFYFGS
ncbi:hypothetical protein ES703_00699 [subsurface metagenome]